MEWFAATGVSAALEAPARRRRRRAGASAAGAGGAGGAGAPLRRFNVLNRRGLLTQPCPPPHFTLFLIVSNFFSFRRLPRGAADFKPAVAQLVEHLTAESAAIRWCWFDSGWPEVCCSFSSCHASKFPVAARMQTYIGRGLWWAKLLCYTC